MERQNSLSAIKSAVEEKYADIEDKNINIYDKHALVLTTNSKISQDSILDYANQIKSKVLEVFNISLEIEPTIISN